MYVQTMNGSQKLMSQVLPLTTAGVRYRMRLPAGTYWLYVDPSADNQIGVPEYVPAGQPTEDDFSSGSFNGCIW